MLTYIRITSLYDEYPGKHHFYREVGFTGYLLENNQKILGVADLYQVEDSMEAMSSLKIMSIYDRLYLRKAKFMFKVYNNLTPSYITENFTIRNNVNTSINLRSSSTGCFIPPKPNTEGFKHSLRYSGCVVWNSLPSDVKSAQTVETFHSRCLKWLTN